MARLDTKDIAVYLELLDVDEFFLASSRLTFKQALTDLQDCREILIKLLTRMDYDIDRESGARNFMEYTQSDIDAIKEVLG